MNNLGGRIERGMMTGARWEVLGGRQMCAGQGCNKPTNIARSTGHVDRRKLCCVGGGRTNMDAKTCGNDIDTADGELDTPTGAQRTEIGNAMAWQSSLAKATSTCRTVGLTCRPARGEQCREPCDEDNANMCKDNTYMSGGRLGLLMAHGRIGRQAGHTDQRNKKIGGVLRNQHQMWQ